MTMEALIVWVEKRVSPLRYALVEMTNSFERAEGCLFWRSTRFLSRTESVSEAGFGFGGHVVDYCFEVSGFAVDAELAVGSASLLEHGVDVADLVATA